MPVVASMGGIAGTQALTIVIRGMALGLVGSSNIRALVSREAVLGLANGLFWSVIVGLAAFAWFGDFTLGYVIGAAIVVNLLVCRTRWHAAAGLPKIHANRSSTCRWRGPHNRYRCGRFFLFPGRLLLGLRLTPCNHHGF
jgi:Mg/Co/Ni transporter MgtE (contains CBS domain)